MKTRNIYEVVMDVDLGEGLGSHQEKWYFDNRKLGANFMKDHCTASITSIDHLGDGTFVIWRGYRFKNKIKERYSMHELELIEEDE